MTLANRLEAATCLYGLSHCRCPAFSLAVPQIPKHTGGHRPLFMMSFLRRVSLESLSAAKKESVAKCAGSLQCGVGCLDVANTMINTIQYVPEADPTRVLVALDLKAAL